MTLWLIGFSYNDQAEWVRLLTHAVPTTLAVQPYETDGALTSADFAIIHPCADSVALPNGLACIRLALPVRFSEVLRQVARWLSQAPATAQQVLNALWSLDVQRRELISSGSTIALTDKETELLAALLRSPQEGISREALLKSIWGYGEHIDSHTLETHIYRLRNKLQPALHAGQGILTTESGYRFTQTLPS